MARIIVRSQAELEAAINAGDTPICIEGRFVLSAAMHAEARENSHVVAWGNSHVVARESSHVEARGNSHVVARENSHVEARESSHVVARENSHVVARENSHVEAWGNSYVEAWGNSHVEARGTAIIRLFSCKAVIAAAMVTVVIHGYKERVTGGIQVEAMMPVTAQAWCEFYGVEVNAGVAIVFKGVGDDYRSPHDTLYAPGASPAAPDWDDGHRECGGGLHFSPHPEMTLEFNSEAQRFIACPVALSDMRAPKNGDSHPSKIKASKCCAPVWECDKDGKRIEEKELITQPTQ